MVDRRLLVCALLCSALFLSASGSPAIAADASLKFVVKVTSTLAQAPVTVTTYVLNGAIRTESVSGSETTISITKGGKTYLLEPGLKLAQVAPVRGPGEGVTAAQQKYWALVDPLQVAPPQLPGLFQSLGARSLGADKLDGVEVDAWALTIPTEVKFPLDNLRLYVRTSDGLPYRLDYQRNREEQVQVRFLEIDQTTAVAAALFEIPEDFHYVEYEWD